MVDVSKILAGTAAGIAGFVTVTLISPFKGERFDYATASFEEKQKFLETKAKNFSRGYNLTKGNASEITGTHIDAVSDLVSMTVKLKGPANGYMPATEVEKSRSIIMRTACTLTDRKLLTETNYTLRIRFFHPNGSKVMTVEASGETCAPYIS